MIDGRSFCVRSCKRARAKGPFAALSQSTFLKISLTFAVPSHACEAMVAIGRSFTVHSSPDSSEFLGSMARAREAGALLTAYFFGHLAGETLNSDRSKLTPAKKK